MRLNLNQLEARENPAPLIPGWDGEESYVRGHFSGGAQLDLAAVALQGGSVRVMVFQGQRTADESADDYSRVLLNEIVFDPNFRGGGRLAVVPAHATEQGGVDTLLAVPGYGGGPQVCQFDFDGGSNKMRLTSSFFAPYSEVFRGGLRVSSGDIDGDGIPEALFLPGEGGGPQLVAVDLRTHETDWSVWVGDPEDRSGNARFDPTGGTIQTNGGRAVVIQYGEPVDDRVKTTLFPY